MKLRYSPTSPYVRKVSMCAIELGLADKLQTIDTNPWDENSSLADDNPLGRVPALTLDGGECLYDSLVICEYLDSISERQQLFPKDDNRWRVLRQHAMLDGILDAGINAVIERLRRPDELKWEDWAQFQLTAVRRALAVFATEITDFDNRPLDIAHITAGATLGYLDFRFGDDIDWRTDHPALHTWYKDFSLRDSMQTTVPKAP